MSEKYPAESTTVNQENGILSHEVAKRLLKKEHPLINDGEIYECAKFYADYILAEAKDNELHIEELVTCDRIHPEISGTPDCWFFANNTLNIYDYKFGHAEVAAEANLQCITYAAGILEKLPGIHGRTVVVITIIQPRCYSDTGSVRKWAATVDELSVYFDELRNAAIQATSPAPRTRSGPHCRYCSARHVCKSAQSAAYNAMDLLDVSIPHELTPDFAARELRQLQLARDAIDYRMSGLEEQVKKWLTSSIPVNNYVLKESYGREKWTLSADEIAELGDQNGVQLRKPLDVITPSQARKKGYSCDYTKREKTYKIAYKGM